MDAELQLWVDGVSRGTLAGWRLSSWTNQSFNEAWGTWSAHWYWQMNGTTGDGGTIYVDDISVDDIYNSIYSGGGGDTTPPTNVTLTAPSAGATVSGTVTISGTCTDETSIRGVQFKRGTTNIGSEDTSSPYSVSWDTTSVSNGAYSLTAVCTDNGGNSTTSAARSVTVSNSAPAQDCPANWKTLHPTWIWCDDFETDKSSVYVDSNYYGSRLARSSGNGRDGSYSLRSTFPAAPGAASNGGDFTIAFGASPVSPTVDAADTTKYRELYWRAYIKTQAGWQPGTGQKLARATSFHNSSWAQSMIAHWWGSSASPENTLQVDPASGVCRGGVYPAGSPSCANNTVITTGWNDFNNLYWLGASAGTAPVLGTAKANTWQCIEGYVKLNDSGQSNGVQTLWVDGVQDASKTGINFVGSYSTYGINIFRLENYMNQGISSSQYRDWDNLVLSKDRVGCAASGTTYTVTPSAGANGSISPSTPQTVSSGGTIGFTVTPNAGYTASVSGCGGSLSGTTYTTGAIASNCSVSATFCKKLSVPASLVATGLVANPPSNATLSFDWSDVTTHADGSALIGDLANYRTYWGTVSGGPYNTSSSASSQISVGPTNANVTYYARVAAESSVNSICNSDQTAEISLFADTVPPVLSGLNPSGNYPKTAANVALGVTTNEAATCRHGSAGSAWSSKTAFSTTGATSHSATLAVWAGLVKRICYQCRDAMLNESAESCTTFSVSAKQKAGGFN